MDDDEQGELIDLSDLSFDFDDYFLRHANDELSEVEKQEYDARVIGIWVREVLYNRPPPDWASLIIAKKFWNVLRGDELAEKFKLPQPWAQYEDPRPKSEIKRIEIYCAVLNRISAAPDRPITELIQAAADEKFVSFQTARAYWYDMVRRAGVPEHWKQLLSKKDGK